MIIAVEQLAILAILGDGLLIWLLGSDPHEERYNSKDKWSLLLLWLPV